MKADKQGSELLWKLPKSERKKRERRITHLRNVIKLNTDELAYHRNQIEVCQFAIQTFQKELDNLTK